MDVTFETDNGIETNETDSVLLNDDEYIPKDNAEDFASLESLYITDRAKNTYYPSEFYDAIGDVTLDVDYNMTTKEINENGTYYPFSGDGFDLIEVDCQGGEYELTTESLVVSHNGVFKSKMADGFSDVEVNICTDYYWEDREFEEYAYDYKSKYVCFDGYLHRLGSTDNPRLHKVFSGSEWQDSVPLPYDFQKGAAIVINGKLHILGSSVPSQASEHWMFDGELWEFVGKLPTFASSLSVCENNGYLYAVGGVSAYQSTAGDPLFTAYRCNISDFKWSQIERIPVASNGMPLLSFNNEVYLVKDEYRYKYTKKGWEEEKLPIDTLTAFVCDDGMSEKMHLIGEDVHYAWDDGEWIIEKNFNSKPDGYMQSVVVDDLWLEVYILGINGYRLDCEKTFLTDD